MEKRTLKAVRGNSVCKTVNYRLTSRGKAIALNLANISKMIVYRLPDSRKTPHPSSHEEFEGEIKESIEVALDSFGINLLPLVRDKLEVECCTRWDEIVHHPDRLMIILRDLFGTEGSSTIESMIVDNILYRFEDIDLSGKGNDLANLVAELIRMRGRSCMYESLESLIIS